MLAGCVGVVTLAVSSVTMWWKRRPKGALGAPPRPAAPRAARGIAAIIAGVGIIYPLVGVSFILALALEASGRLRLRHPHWI